jgi:hypothetical protein
MTRGFLIYAHNNAGIDYGVTALCAALMIKANLADHAVCLVTDSGTLDALRRDHGDALVDHAFEHVVLEPWRRVADGATARSYQDTRSTRHSLPWYNGTRPSAYGHSPFEETILIDSDYLVMDRSLDLAWGGLPDVMINRAARSLDHAPPAEAERRLDSLGIDMYWATVVYFRKSETARILFDLVAHVREHYEFYRHLYGFPGRLYRNDYAFSIAAHVLNGFSQGDVIAPLPVPTLLTSFDTDELIGVPARNEAIFLIGDPAEEHRFRVTRTRGLSVHCMNKFSLVRMAPQIIDQYYQGTS